MLDEIIHFLNDLNREYATGAADYHWNGYHDNCVHTLRNALAAASIGEPISVRATKLLQLFHLACRPTRRSTSPRSAPGGRSIPTRASSATIPCATRCWSSAGCRRGTARCWSRCRCIPDNEVFDPQPRLLVFQGPVTMRTHAAAARDARRPALHRARAEPAPLRGDLPRDPVAPGRAGRVSRRCAAIATGACAAATSP